MIRITGGQFRGRQLHCPKGKAVRPTTAFVRESLFSMLGSRIQNARFLDLFAGCGVVGFEALSRGASCVVAVEKAPAHCRVLEKNRATLRIEPEVYQVVCQDVFRWIQRWPVSDTNRARFDLIFMDPPYRLPHVEQVVEESLKKRLLAPEGLLIWESGCKEVPAVTGAHCIESRQYGESVVRIFTYPQG